MTQVGFIIGHFRDDQLSQSLDWCTASKPITWLVLENKIKRQSKWPERQLQITTNFKLMKLKAGLASFCTICQETDRVCSLAPGARAENLSNSLQAFFPRRTV